MTRRTVLLLLVLIGLVFSGAPTVAAVADAAPSSSCAAQARSIQARIQAHNAKPHVFRVPQQQAQANAYNAEAAGLRAEQAQWRARCMAVAPPKQRPALPPAAPKRITGYTDHGQQNRLNRNGHGVNDAALRDAVHHPTRVVRQTGQYGTTFRYEGRNATVVLNSQGKVVTCWPRNRAGWRQ
jgi:dihydroorotate dehydrogenase